MHIIQEELFSLNAAHYMLQIAALTRDTQPLLSYLDYHCSQQLLTTCSVDCHVLCVDIVSY